MTVSLRKKLTLPEHLLLAYRRLGDYEPNHFSDDKVRQPLCKFQEALEDIETELVDE